MPLTVQQHARDLANALREICHQQILIPMDEGETVDPFYADLLEATIAEIQRHADADLRERTQGAMAATHYGLAAHMSRMASHMEGMRQDLLDWRQNQELETADLRREVKRLNHEVHLLKTRGRKQKRTHMRPRHIRNALR
jgi:hypothetical protein